MSEREYYKIAAAAIRSPDGEVFTLPPPARHHTIIHHLVSELGHPRGLCGYEQGFVTECGKWLRRKPAARHALKSGQISKLSYPPRLYSEDLW